MAWPAGYPQGARTVWVPSRWPSPHIPSVHDFQFIVCEANVCNITYSDWGEGSKISEGAGFWCGAVDTGDRAGAVRVLVGIVAVGAGRMGVGALGLIQ